MVLVTKRNSNKVVGNWIFRYPDEKTIGVGMVLRGLWIIASLGTAVEQGVKGNFQWVGTYFLTGIIWMPSLNLWIKEKTGFGISRGLKFLIIIFLYAWGIYAFGSPT